MTSLLASGHVMAVLALGLLIGQQRWSLAVTAVYGAGLLTGLGTVMLAYVPTFAEQGLLAATALAGLLLAWSRPLPALVGAVLAAATGLSLALDSPPEALSLARANTELAITAAGAFVGVSAVAALGARLDRGWLHFGARILGSWIAASAILVLALLLVR